MLSLAQGKWEETVTTGILCHSTSYHRYPLTTNNCLSEVFPKSLTPLNTPMVDICISSPPPPQLAYNVCPFGRGGGLYPTNGEARSHFYIPGISRGREETDDSEKMYINYGSFRKISWDIWKKLLNTWKGKCFLMYKRCFCFILKIRFWHDEHLQHAKNISKKTTCLSNKRRIFLF